MKELPTIWLGLGQFFSNVILSSVGQIPNVYLLIHAGAYKKSHPWFKRKEKWNVVLLFACSKMIKITLLRRFNEV